MMAEATIANNEPGKDWLKFVDDNLLLTGMSNGYNHDGRNADANGIMAAEGPSKR